MKSGESGKSKERWGKAAVVKSGEKCATKLEKVSEK